MQASGDFTNGETARLLLCPKAATNIWIIFRFGEDHYKGSDILDEEIVLQAT